MTKKVELQPGLAIEELYDLEGRPIGLEIQQSAGKAGVWNNIKISPQGVIKLAEFLENLVA
jgi:hypothetical protein